MERSLSRPCLSGYWSGRVNCDACQAPAVMPLQPVRRFLASRALLEAESYSLPAGATLFHAGDPAASVFSIRQGFLKLWREDCAGRYRIVRLLGPGDMAGLETLVRPTYGLTATAVAPAQLCMIPRALLERIEQERPEIHRDIERRWHAQLAQTDRLLLEVVVGPARQRVTSLLRYLAEWAAPEPCPRIRRLDMGALLDVAPENVARVIADLKRAGLLKETAAHLVFDPEKL
jgi:CRP-like cAMP-binding protein